MPVAVLSGALQGVDAIPIEVEVDLLQRLPSVCIVGLAANAVKESAERIRSAIASSLLEFPRKRVVINLIPADVRKDGTALDLPMALGILAAEGRVPEERVNELIAVGELSLTGALRPVRGALSMAILARSIGRTLVLPSASASAAALVPGAKVVAADSLADVVGWLLDEHDLPSVRGTTEPLVDSGIDLADVRGQPVARKALEIAAAGAHHLWMSGPPGCGKSVSRGAAPSAVPSTRRGIAADARPWRLHHHEEDDMTIKTNQMPNRDPERSGSKHEPQPWKGRCPDCGGRAVFREVAPGRIVGACDEASRCLWTTA